MGRASKELHSCVYEGAVVHHRRRERRHSFRQRLAMLYIDLSELDQIFANRWLWSTSRPAIGRFDRRDFHGEQNQPLEQSVRQTVHQRLGRSVEGPIRMLAQIRYYGYIINPVVFYFCFSNDESTVDAVLADVTNTPWKETYTYVMPGPAAGSTHWRHACEKQFHVSPFLPMAMQYRWSLQVPDQRMALTIENWDDQGRAFHARLALQRRPIDGRTLAKVLCQYPIATTAVFAGIYWQAFRLWRKRITFYPHPGRDSSSTPASKQSAT